MNGDPNIERLADTGALVLLYHSVFERQPPEMSRGLHNVRPGVMRAQIEGLGEYFRFVDVDELAASADPRGLAAVTFDDGYRSVFDVALPVLESLGVPATVFLNGASFEGACFWRDKVRYVESMGWVDDFEAFCGDRFCRIEGKRFYRYTKSPSVNSGLVDRILDEFLDARGVLDSLPRYCVGAIEDLPAHELIAYGNHGHHHYVMSSLTPTEQAGEIASTDALLSRLAPRRISRLFSLPFGAETDANADTAAALADAGYETVLMSRGRAYRSPAIVHGLRAVERFMPKDHARDFGLDTLLCP